MLVGVELHCFVVTACSDDLGRGLSAPRTLGWPSMKHMEVSPQAIATTTFRVVKKGYDPDEVRSYLGELSRAMDTAQAHAQTMEARARQAMAKAERLATSSPTTSTSAPTESIAVTPSSAQSIESQPLPSGADTISRTLLLAQQTAEATVTKAQQEAAELKASSEAEAKSVRENAASTAAKAVEQARHEARTVGDEEKARIEGEIHQLLARLEFLRGDIDQLEKHSANHRQRLLESADALRAVAETPNSGFASVRRPVLSGASDSLKADFADRDAATAAASVTPAEPTTVDASQAAAVDADAPSTGSLFDTADEVGADDAGSAATARVDAPRHGEAADSDITAEVPVVQS